MPGTFGNSAAIRSKARTRGHRLRRRGAGLMTVAMLFVGGAFLSSGAHVRAGFQPGATYALPASEADMIKADFNRDGKTDLALVGADLLVYLGNGDGTFTAEAPVALPSNFAGGVHLLAGDFNGDGKLDLVINGWQNNSGFLSPSHLAAHRKWQWHVQCRNAD